MTPENLASLAGIALSLLFSYVPGFADWYAARDRIQKRLIMLGLLFVCAIAIFGLACIPAEITPPLQGGVGGRLTCDQPGALVLTQAFIAAAIANQAL